MCIITSALGLCPLHEWVIQCQSGCYNTVPGLEQMLADQIWLQSIILKCSAALCCASH